MDKNIFVEAEKRLQKLSTIQIKNDKDLLDFFTKVNSIIKDINLYCDVSLAKNEVKELVDDYIKLGGINDTIQYDIPLFVEENVAATDFSVTFIDLDGTERESTADIVLQCDININNDRYSITPSIFFIVYETDDEEEITEEEDVEDQPLSDEEPEEDSEELEFDPEFADDEIIREFLKNLIVSKIYEEGYEYPNEETINELVEKMYNAINDMLEEAVNGFNNEPEEEEEEESEDNVSISEPTNNDGAPPLIDGDAKISKLKSGIEIYEKDQPKYYFSVTARYLSDVVPFIVPANSEEEAIRIFNIEHSEWEIIDILKLERNELFGNN